MTVSFEVRCRAQEEVDDYWDRLGAGGDEKAQQCGRLKHRHGRSWQVVPSALIDMINDPDQVRSQPVISAMLQMKTFDIAALRRAFDG